MDSLKNFSARLANDQDKKTHPEDKAPLSLNANDVKNKIYGQYTSLKEQVQSEVDLKITNAKSTMKEMDSMLKSQLKPYIFELNKWVRQKVISSIILAAEEMRPKVKSAVKDPDMCVCIQNLVDDTVDDIWPELIDEIKINIMMKVDVPFVTIPHKKTLVCFYPCLAIRNWYLYSSMPYDRSIWKQLKSVYQLLNLCFYPSSFWIWTAISAFPLYGVSQFFFVWDFLMRDHEDEFQMVQYILNFKTMYFVTQGMLKAIIGYFLLYNCATMINKANKDELVECGTSGPGANMQIYSELIGFFCQVLFIYIAFFLLPITKQKGKPIFAYSDHKNEEGCCPRGGRLKYFMVWDLLVLGGSIGLFFMVYTMQKSPDIQNGGDYIFFAQVIYGLLSFPFLLFNIPLLKDRLTKAKTTAYDKKGNCVPTMKGVRFDYGTENTEKNFIDQLSLNIEDVIDF